MSTHNPYTPPAATVSDAPLRVAIASKPVSVWLLQIVCGLAVFVILNAVPRSFAKWSAAPPGDIARVALLIAVLLELLVASLFAWTIVAAQRRSQFGRWLGVFMMAILISIVAFAFSNAGILGRFTVTASALAPLGLLLYFPAFSKRARAWYGE